MTLDEVAVTVRRAAETVLVRRALDPGALPATVPLSRPREARHGDLASTVILRGEVPEADRASVAAEVARELTGAPGIAAAWADGPGFLGLRLDDRSVAAAVRDLVLGGPPATPPTFVDPPSWLTEAVGAPAARYAWAGPGRPRPSDTDRWIRATDDNPYYVVQYAGVTAANISRWAADLGLERAGEPPAEARDLQIDLVTFPWSARPPDAVTRALARVTAGYQRFVSAGRVLPVGDEPAGPDHRRRLWLSDAVRVVVAAGLARLGIEAADRI